MINCRPKIGYIIEESELSEIKEVTEEFQRKRDEKFKYNERISKMYGKDLRQPFYGEYMRNQLFDFSYPIIENENEKLKRILCKK
ncbi:MAG: hypothetical protein K2M17_04770 [Bacilli bacterium]|nr:hypothetical protein [Bacilli bacterium]